MSERRHRGDVAPRSPPRRRGFGGEAGGNRRFSRSYRSPSPVRAYDSYRRYRSPSPVRAGDSYRRCRGDDRDRYRPLGIERRYGDARTHSPSRPTTGERGEYEMNRRFRSLNRSTDSALPKPDRFVGVAPVQRSDCGKQRTEDRDVQFEKLSRFSESLSRKDSTFMKFQWHNLLPDKSTNGKSNASRDFSLSNFNGNRNDSGKISGFSELGVVPRSVPMENGGSRASSGYRVDLMSGRKNGLIEDGGHDSNLGKFGGETERTNFSSLSLPLKSPLEDMRIIKPMNVTDVRDNVKQNMVLDNHQYRDTSTVSHVEDYLDYGSRKHASLDHDSLQQVENFRYERDSGNGSGDGRSGSCGGDFKGLPTRYGGLYPTESSSLEQEFVVQELDIHNPSDMILGRKYGMEVETSQDGLDSESYYEWYAFDNKEHMKSGATEWTDKDLELSLSENSRFSCSKGGVPARILDGMRSPENVNYDYPLLYRQGDTFSNPDRPSKGDMKKRLGPARNVKQRLGPVPNLRKGQGPARNVKQRLGPIPHSGKSLRGARKLQKELPWIKVREQRTQGNYDSSIVTNGLEASYVEKKAHAKTEPPEYSDEFMQLVQLAFLKFFKFLNENSAKRRKYMDQGGTGVLKCIVCGSKSKEFVDTSSLAQHAFTSCKVGYRSEHLGLHKAFCVLMGWSCSHMPKGPWVRHMLPESEALSIKEDLIIWPPVVIVQNSSVTSENPGERMIVSVEQLGSLLRAMGFGQGMTSICRGKAANHSTMVVNFSGTFSGLLQAERLHKHYAANKHGRAEVQKFGVDSSTRSSQETESVPADKEVESILYGYLGIAGDLDKLGIETKKQCVVKSKKEIEAVAEASFNT